MWSVQDVIRVRMYQVAQKAAILRAICAYVQGVSELSKTASGYLYGLPPYLSGTEDS
jgi:hypothetical protein